AVNNDVTVVLLLERRDVANHVTTQHGGVVPLRVLQGGGDDVLGHRVELVRHLALEVRPDGSKAVVGAATEQQRARGHRLVELVLVALRAAREGVGPADPLEVLGPTGRLDDSVDGDVLGDHEPAHTLLSPSLIGAGRSNVPQGRGPVLYRNDNCAALLLSMIWA